MRRPNRSPAEAGSDDPDAPDAGQDPAAARESALRLLTRREHSAAELAGKLAQRGWLPEIVDPLIARLEELGLQSDRRFAEAFSRQRAERSYGPRRIRAELNARGIDADLACEVIDGLEIDFREQAAAFYRRKYGQIDTGLEYRERARRAQALYRRGFESEHFRDLLRND